MRPGCQENRTSVQGCLLLFIGNNCQAPPCNQLTGLLTLSGRDKWFITVTHLIKASHVFGLHTSPISWSLLTALSCLRAINPSVCPTCESQCPSAANITHSNNRFDYHIVHCHRHDVHVSHFQTLTRNGFQWRPRVACQLSSKLTERWARSKHKKEIKNNDHREVKHKELPLCISLTLPMTWPHRSYKQKNNMKVKHPKQNATDEIQTRFSRHSSRNFTSLTNQINSPEWFTHRNSQTSFHSFARNK